ncbi:protein artichoke [Harmonia axyridis]|uniref:protein artichoke n=1 Tax=Harmonia axyridis TaxID=115357 RepID=UPI001E2758EE|nr:protein artichoke [Harmonia axyridis]
MNTVLYAAAVFFLLQVYGGYIPPGPKYRCPKEKLLLHPCWCTKESDEGLEVACNNTNLASMSVALNNLATYDMPIERLTIYKCHIRRLFGSLLYKLQLRVLEIRDTPIETIEEHTLLGVNGTLKELHLINTSLAEFPKLAFRILSQLTILNVDQHKMTNLPKDILSDSAMTGTLLKLYLSNGLLDTPPVEAFQPLRKLKILDLHGNNMVTLVRNQFRGLRDVERLDLSFNKIKKIDGSHMADLTKLGWLNVSHNALTEITRGAFARNTVLKVLNMSHNSIKRLDSNTFRGMRFLRRIYLSDNKISDVARGTFASLTRIGTIDLARNLLEKVDYQMFYQLNYLELIDLSQNNITEVQKLSFKDVYFAKIDLSRNNISVIENGAFENCANISVLDLSHNSIDSFARKVFDETTYAAELRLSYNKLTSLNEVPLANMSGLKILNVSHNELIKIPKSTFPKLYELHTIDLSHNNLTEIFNSVFQTLFSLRFLNLSYNHMNALKPSTFGALPTLLELDMSHNLLKKIARGAFTRLDGMRRLLIQGNMLGEVFTIPQSVSYLDLSNNQLTHLPDKLWPSMNSLLELDLGNNQLADNLTSQSFSGLLTVQRLHLNNNGIQKPPYEALKTLSSLQYLYLQDNNITMLGKAAFGNLPVVFELNLANNSIRNVSVRAFDGLLQLLTLNLTNNNISYIPNGAFHGLVALTTLDLSHNKLEKLDNKTNGLLDDCLSLQRVNLSHNKISFVTRKTFPSDPYIPYKLKEVDLSYNAMPIITFDLTIGTKKLEKLNLSHNAISDIRRWVIGNLTKLSVLDLSNNKLADLTTDKEIFKLPPNLTELYLADNRLGNLPWKTLTNLTQLEVLDLRRNNFNTINRDLTHIITKNVSVFFEGNPLRCDCFLRPLKRYFNDHLALPPQYKELRCTQPTFLAEKKFHYISDTLLNCPFNLNNSKVLEEMQEDYDITPDFRFRRIEIKDNKIFLRWRVMKREADIADTYVVIRNLKPHSNVPEKPFFERTLQYFKRSVDIDLDAELRKHLNHSCNLQVCILGSTSQHIIRSFYSSQCKDMCDLTVKASGASRNQNVILLTFFISVFIFTFDLF